MKRILFVLSFFWAMIFNDCYSIGQRVIIEYDGNVMRVDEEGRISVIVEDIVTGTITVGTITIKRETLQFYSDKVTLLPGEEKHINLWGGNIGQYLPFTAIEVSFTSTGYIYIILMSSLKDFMENRVNRLTTPTNPTAVVNLRPDGLYMPGQHIIYVKNLDNVELILYYDILFFK